VGIFFSSCAVVVWPSFGAILVLANGYINSGITYTLMSRRASSADGDWGMKKTEAATKKAMNEQTVVKNPKTFWTRVNPECILNDLVWEF
jgi:hypothetical protein